MKVGNVALSLGIECGKGVHTFAFGCVVKRSGWINLYRLRSLPFNEGAFSCA